MPIATNPQTGETVFLGDDGQWKPAQTAVNPQTKEMLAFDGKGWTAVPAKSKGVLGYIDDAVRSIANGLTFGFADELSARANSMLGRGSYEDNVKAERERDAQIHPGIAIPGQIAGALAVPVGGLMGGATMGARALRGAGVGGAFGALAGAGEGTDATSRAAGALTGGAIGAATGGAAVPVVEGASRLVGAALSKPIEIVRSAINPDAAAERAVGRAYQDAARIDPTAANRLAQGEVTPGGPAAVLDTLGEGGRNLARSAANISGEASDTLNRTLNDRYTGQSGRFVGWLQQRFGAGNAFDAEEAIRQTAQTVNRPAYIRAYAAGDREIWNPELERLTASPSVQSALNSAITKWRDYQVRDGYGAANPPFRVENGGLIRTGGRNAGMPAYPNIQLWDYAARELQDRAREAPRGSQAAGLQNDLARLLKNELDRIVPEYGTARRGAAGFFNAENALEAGQNFVTENFAAPATRAALARMSQAERQLFQQGFVSRYIEQINQTPDRADVVRRIYSSPAAREKIEIALGPQNARELEAMLRVENIMQQGLRGVQGNSTTARQLTQLGLAGAAGGAIGAGGGGALGYDPTMGGIVGALTAAGKTGVDRRVAERVARLLVSDDQTAINRAITSLASSPRMLQALRAADAASAKSLGSQSGVLQITVNPWPGIQGPVVGRAEYDQPSVPRIPGQ